MLAFSNDYYGFIFRATQSVELFCAYEEYLNLAEISMDRLRNWDEKTRIGVNGEKLSVGQQQRLAIARALTSRSKVLVFDEIFRNLDAETTRRILSNLVGKGYILLYFEENEVLDKFQTREILFTS